MSKNIYQNHCVSPAIQDVLSCVKDTTKAPIGIVNDEFQIICKKV